MGKPTVPMVAMRWDAQLKPTVSSAASLLRLIRGTLKTPSSFPPMLPAFIVSGLLKHHENTLFEWLFQQKNLLTYEFMTRQLSDLNG